MLRKNKGITLVALVVTIIVLIILAGVSISLVLGQGGIVQKAKEGRDTYAEAAKLENEQLANVDVFTATIGDTTAPTGAISNMTGGELTLSATINLGENTDPGRTRYVFTTSQEPLGTNDESLYKDGTIEETSATITKSKAAGTYYLHIFAVSKNGFKSEIISDTTATSQGKKDFSYTGNIQNATLIPGNYKLEVWGASGGGASYSYNYDYGGHGGYSVGNLNLNEQTTLYIAIGGQGTKATGSGSRSGGYNGGGTGSDYAGSGGGATHIGLKTGLLTTFSSDYQTNLIMVAGAGGGANAYGGNQNESTGGAGGGESGIAGGTNSNWGYQSHKSGPGTQTSYGTNSSTSWNNNAGFGRGSDYYSSYCGGGGAGFYGGACGAYHGGSGAGGSGYVNTSKLTESQTIAGNTTIPSTTGSTETGHTGHGYARITAID